MTDRSTATTTSHRTLVLVLVPPAVLGLVLFALAWGTFQRDLTAADDRLARSLAQRVALEAREALQSRDAAALARVAELALGDPGVLSVTIEDAGGHALAHAGATDNTAADSWFRRRLTTSLPPAVYTARVPQVGARPGLSNVAPRAALGRIVLQVSRAPAVARQITVLVLAALASLIVLGSAAVATMRRRRVRTARLAHLLETLREYEVGAFGSRVPEVSAGTLGRIEQCVNRVADAMARSQEDLQIQVDRSTRELRQTLEEVEIKNVQLDLARKRAVGASQAKSDFLANMSHEIRTPMNAVVGYTQLLASTTLDDDQRGYLETIQGAADNLLGIIDDILNLSRLEAGKLVIQERPFSLGDCVGQLTELLAPSAFRKGLDFIRIVDPRVPDQLLGDPLRVRQILTNLISNAIKFTAEGQVRLTADRVEADAGSMQIRFDVVDTGPGISEGDRGRLFQPFSRGANVDQMDTGGTGLGLAISKRLCEAMRGRISVQSNAGNGSCFTVVLPLQPAGPVAATAEPGFDGRRIVIHAADDALRAWLADRFGRRGARVQTVASLSALAACAAGADPAEAPVDLLLVTLGIEELRARVAPADFWPAGVPMPPVLALVSSADRSELSGVASRTGAVTVPACAPESVIDEAAARICAPVAAGSGPSHAARDQAGASGTDGGALTVLVAEDNEINRRYLVKILGLHGIACDWCENGEQAVKMATEKRYDAVLMDIRMPVMDGVEATRRIRAHPACRQLPVLGLTASALPEERLRYMRHGLDDCLVKPVKPQMLVAMIRRMADQAEAAAPSDAPATGATPDPELLALLREELPGRVERMRYARRAGDNAALRGEVHKINGAAAVLRLHDLWQAAGSLEGCLMAGDTAGIDGPFDTLVAQVEAVLDGSAFSSTANATTSPASSVSET